ncbi:hypothetical protein OpiT1DRAFT_00170 [Opitutaceae bacterium TAV1]|nr:hypothetical protein OpiT1DRAFT_00170 [Opitutaceae bacterium TAV1]
MRLIKNSQLQKLAARHPTCLPAVATWKNAMRKGKFTDLVSLRKVFPHADQVTTRSKRTVTIFNLGNHYRLITAIHYNCARVFILRLLSHAEYDKESWKKEL